MALPNPGMDFTPLATLPSAELDKIVANIEALAAGTGQNAASIASSKLNLGVTVDANGWTVIDLGVVKLYIKTSTFEWGSISANSYASVGSINNPVGETEASIRRVHSATLNGNSPFFSIHIEGNAVYLRNLSAGAVDPGTVRVSCIGIKG